MSGPRRTTALALAAIAALGAASVLWIDRGVVTGGSRPDPEPLATTAVPPAWTSTPEALAHELASSAARPPSPTPPANGTSVVGRLMAQRRPEDLELLATVARRTNAAPPRAVNHLLDAARAGADDAELTRIIREDVQGALVRHDCFEWLRRRRGEPRPKLPAFAARVPRSGP